MECPRCRTDNPEDSKFCKGCGTRLGESMESCRTQTFDMPAEELAPKSLFAGRYLILEVLGKGGMGRVYRAEDTKLKQEIALKLIKPEIASDQKTIERFRNELKTARMISHRNVCRMFDLGEDKGQHFITMESVTGENLKSYISRSGSLPIEKSVSIAKQICEGLAEAHRLGVVHRDLKPNNIMIDRQDNVRIMDFGISRNQEDSGLTGPGMMIGTPDYMSPEQAAGEEVDQRSDIYSFGVTLYEMLTGRIPYEGNTPLSVIYKHKYEPPLDPRKINNKIPEFLCRLVLKCLAKDKSSRYQNVEEIISDFVGDNASSSPSEDVIQKDSTRLPFSTLQERRPNNLPIQPTRIIGRDADIKATMNLFSQTEVRLLTLTGPGGIGKTRLGLQLAEQLLEDFDDGVFFVSLAPIRDPTLVVSTIAQALGVGDHGSRSILENLREYLIPKKVLLFLDNFEHVCQAAQEVMHLLETCPHIKFLITSREVLHLHGEHEYFVHPLSLPEVNRRLSTVHLEKSPAVELFVQRAQAVKPGFAISDKNAQAVAEICIRLDGLPLAIELAAARIKLFPPKALLNRIDEAKEHTSLHLLSRGPRDAPERHRTLHAAMDWSYDLLDENEQKLLQTLSAFSGGFSLDAAEAVCCRQQTASDPIPGEVLSMDVMEGLASLLDKSLLRQDERGEDEPRFTMLELIREYAAEKLRKSGCEAIVRNRHADFYRILAKKAKTMLRGPEQKIWLDRLEVEHNNLRAALDWYQKQAKSDTSGSKRAVESGMRMVGALWQFWDTHGYVSEGRKWLKLMCGLTDATTPDYVNALIGAGCLASRQSEMAEAIKFYEQAINISRKIGYKAGTAEALGGMVCAKEFVEADKEWADTLYSESLELWREVGDKRGIATALGPIAHSAASSYDFDKAKKLYSESLSLFREVQDKREIAGALWNLAQIEVVLGNYDNARKMYSESLEIYQELKDVHGAATQLRGLGRVERHQGNPDKARTLYEGSLDSFRSMGDKGCASIALAGLARVALDQDDLEGAKSLISECMNLSRKIGFRSTEALALRLLGYCSLSQGELESAISYFIKSIHLEKDLNHREGIAENFEGIAAVSTARSEFEKAVRFFSAAEALRDKLRIPLSPVDAEAIETWKTIASKALKDAALSSSEAEGRTLTLEQALILIEDQEHK